MSASLAPEGQKRVDYGRMICGAELALYAPDVGALMAAVRYQQPLDGSDELRASAKSDIC